MGIKLAMKLCIMLQHHKALGCVERWVILTYVWRSQRSNSSFWYMVNISTNTEARVIKLGHPASLPQGLELCTEVCDVDLLFKVTKVKVRRPTVFIQSISWSYSHETLYNISILWLLGGLRGCILLFGRYFSTNSSTGILLHYPLDFKTDVYTEVIDLSLLFMVKRLNCVLLLFFNI